MKLNIVSLPDVTALYLALFLLLMLALAINVVRWRWKAHVSLGDGDHRDLRAAIRSHGNAAEYVPLVLLAMAVVEMLGAPESAMHIYGSAFLLARVLHPIGLSQRKTVNKLRQVGVLGTWVTMVALAVHLLVLL